MGWLLSGIRLSFRFFLRVGQIRLRARVLEGLIVNSLSERAAWLQKGGDVAFDWLVLLVLLFAKSYTVRRRVGGWASS